MVRFRSILAVLAGAALLGVPGTAGAQESDFVITFPHRDAPVRFINDYGVFAKDRIHRGVDIFSPRGTPVVAVADGFVQKARYGSNAGFYVVIRHADGWESWYLHLSAYGPDGWRSPFAEGVEVGAFVKAGQLIGWVGNTGNAHATRPHTHFELHRYGRWVNPYPRLMAAWNRLDVELALEAGTTPYR